MVLKNYISDYLFELLENGHIDNSMYKSYLKRPDAKTFRKIIEAQYILDNDDIIFILGTTWDNKFNNIDNVWKDIEITIFRTLLRNNGTATISELVKKSKMDIQKVRNAIKGLEEDEKLVKSITYKGNTKLVFICNDYLKKRLK